MRTINPSLLLSIIWVLLDERASSAFLLAHKAPVRWRSRLSSLSSNTTGKLD